MGVRRWLCLFKHLQKMLLSESAATEGLESKNYFPSFQTDSRCLLSSTKYINYQSLYTHRLKGKIHPKMKIAVNNSFNIIPNLYEWLSFVESKRCYYFYCIKMIKKLSWLLDISDMFYLIDCTRPHSVKNWPWSTKPYVF